MIYLADDYISRYCEVLSYLIGKSVEAKYSFNHIEKAIAYSKMIEELERSNVTTIAFSSMPMIYKDIFEANENSYKLDVYDIFGWVGYTYMHLFLKLEITFEALFNIVPIQEMLKLYKLYHEMSFSQMLDYVKEIMDNSILDVVMKNKKWTNQKLSLETKIPLATVKSLRYGLRDISKLEADKLLTLSRILDIKMETLLPNIHLIKK